jgi:hypothetical protein
MNRLRRARHARAPHYGGDYVWNYPAKDKVWRLGWTGTTPVMGGWNGDGKTKAGAFIKGWWHLDYNGNAAWDGSETDRIRAFGAAGGHARNGALATVAPQPATPAAGLSAGPG